MDYSIAERILRVVKKRLQLIRKDDGYSTNAGLHVFRARRTVKTDELPCASVWSGDESSTDKQIYKKFNNQLSIAVDGLTFVDQDDTGEMLELLKADIKRALFGDSKNGGITDENGLKAAMYFDGCTPSPREDGANTEGIRVNLVVLYPENVGDPSSQE